VHEINGLSAHQLVQRCETSNAGLYPPYGVDRGNVWIDHSRYCGEAG
jgi:hypothetical protein